MGLFGKRPKLPSYASVGLESLLQDPEWATAIARAGITPSRCEVVIRVAEALVMGADGMPHNAEPAILFGQDTILAIAYPDEREVRVLTRGKSRAQLQTQRSGFFQIMFGHNAALDVFGFYGHEDNLQRGTTEGEAFGQALSAFLADKLRPQQIVGTPQNLATQLLSLRAASVPGASSPPGVHQNQDTTSITPELLHEARRFMEDWTHIVGQAPDEVFWPALARFGRIGGALQGSALLTPLRTINDKPELRRILDRPWQVWSAIGQRALENGDLELTAWVFLFAYVMTEQVAFDADVIARCGFREPSDESYRAIAAHALAAADRAPDGWSLVERTSSAPTTKAQLQTGLRRMLQS